MKFRLTLIILIGAIACGVTYFMSNQGNDSNANILSLNKPFNKNKKVKAKPIDEKPLLSITDKFIATHRNEALLESRLETGREDPFEPLGSLESIHKKLNKQAGKEESVEDLPPPPDDNGGQGLLPPPPVLTGMNLPPDPSQSISTSELPLPPENQELNKKLSLNAVVGDKVILAFNDYSYARAHDYERYITLGRGDSFKSIKLVDISNDKVVIEENGLTHELKISEIR